MKIFLNIEADSPSEMAAALQGLAGIGLAPADASGKAQVASVLAAAAAEPTPADEPKKSRGRPKADAKAPTPEPEPQTESVAAEAEPAPAEAETDIKPITREEVKNSVIDLLNDWTEAMPKDGGPEATTVIGDRTVKVAAIRTDILSWLLPQLGASGKISTIPEENFGKVQALIDESREKLAEYAAQREVEE